MGEWAAYEKQYRALTRPIPAEVAEQIPNGVTASQARERAAALRLARRIGAPAREAIARALATAAPREARWLEAAIAVLDGKTAPAEPPADEPIDLLRRLVAAWGVTHDPALEEPIARIGISIAHGRGTLVSTSKGELEAAWLALADKCDVGDVDRLLDAPWPSSWKPATLRVNALAKFPPDPRIATKLMQVARAYESPASKPLHVTIAELVAKMPTPQLGTVLDHFNSYGRRVGNYYKVKEALARLESSDADPALIAEANRAKPIQDVAALFAEHDKHPGDLALRTVLADALQASGDPRGEFIMLQTAIAEGRADQTARRRAAQLLNAHIDRWTGQLPRIERDTRRFERGFLVALRTSANGNEIANSIDVPEWRTVEELHVSGYADLAPLVRRMPLLRTLWTPSPEALDRLSKAGRFPSLRAIGASTWVPKDRNAFPHLSVLACSWFLRGERLDGIARAARALELDAIAYVGCHIDALPDIVATRRFGPPQTRVVVGPDLFDAGGWRIAIERDEPTAQIAFAPTPAPRYRELREQIVTVLERAGIRATEVDTLDINAPADRT